MKQLKGVPTFHVSCHDFGKHNLSHLIHDWSWRRVTLSFQLSNFVGTIYHSICRFLLFYFVLRINQRLLLSWQCRIIYIILYSKGSYKSPAHHLFRPSRKKLSSFFIHYPFWKMSLNL